MTVSHDTLIRFVYGELSPDDARQVALELERDPELRAVVEQQRKIKARLQSAEDATPSAPQAAPEPAARKFALSGNGVRNAVAAAAAVAGLALGVLVSGPLDLNAGPIREKNGVLFAGGALASALSSHLSSQDAQGGVRIASSFRSTRLSFCRSFVLDGGGADGLAGIACRERGAWRIVLLGDAPPMNGAELPSAVQSAVTSLIAGEPFDETAERAARDDDWRAR